MSEFVMIKKIGSGSFGQVYLVRDRNHNVRIFKVTKSDGLPQLKNEAKILLQLKHPNIMEFYSLEITPALGIPDWFVSYYITGEYIVGCDCEKFLNAKPDIVPNKVVKKFAIEMGGVLDYLKTAGVVHRDIKLANIMMSRDERKFKLIDFGLAFQKDGDENNAKKRRMVRSGTPIYMAPEIFTLHSYSYESDIWAFGVCLYQMISKGLPFNAKTFSELGEKVNALVYVKLEGVFQELLDKIFVVEPEKRINAKDIIKFATDEFPI